jgi:Tfp pilus assembly protein PilF
VLEEGRKLCYRGDYQAAREKLEAVVQADPQIAEARACALRCAFEPGEIDSTIQSYDSRVRESPEGGVLRDALGVAYLKSDLQFSFEQKAFDTLQESAALNPRISDTYLKLSAIRSRRFEDDQSQTYLSKGA